MSSGIKKIFSFQKTAPLGNIDDQTGADSWSGPFRGQMGKSGLYPGPGNGGWFAG